MLDTMTEIMQILYARVQERCQNSVLGLHNQTFLHAIACEEVIGKPIILTEKNFYGHYLHSLVCHTPIQHRIICSRSTNTEQQESYFNTFVSISLETSSSRTWRDHHPWPDQDASRDDTSKNQWTKSHSRARVMTGETIQVLTKSRK